MAMGVAYRMTQSPVAMPMIAADRGIQGGRHWLKEKIATTTALFLHSSSCRGMGRHGGDVSVAVAVDTERVSPLQLQ
eukprot:scaffold2429_cov214-Alexandrium_tamarense.AAC.3